MSTRIRPNDLRVGDIITVTARHSLGEPALATSKLGDAVVSLEDGTRLIIPPHATIDLEHREAPNLSHQPVGAVIRVTVGTGRAITWMKSENGWSDPIWISQKGKNLTENAFANQELRTNTWTVIA